VKGNPISLFADVNCGPVVVPTGNLSYFENGNANPLGTLPLDGNGEATLDATALITSVGVHTLHVSYSGDANCAPSQSVDRTLEIDGSSVNLTTGTFRTLGFPIKLQADVSCGATVPTGTASFFENGNAVALGQVPLDADGSAVLDLTNTLTVPGNHVYHATY